MLFFLGKKISVFSEMQGYLYIQKLRLVVQAVKYSRASDGGSWGQQIRVEINEFNFAIFKQMFSSKGIRMQPLIYDMIKYSSSSSGPLGNDLLNAIKLSVYSESGTKFGEQFWLQYIVSFKKLEQKLLDDHKR